MTEVGAGLNLRRWLRYRRGLQLGFFVLFLVAPALNLLRFDLTETQLWFLGQRWSLGIDALRAGTVGPGEAAFGLLWRAFLPGLALIAGFLLVAWRYGRLYCGWLCPHFSMVELINGLLLRASGKRSVWDRKPTVPVKLGGAAGCAGARYGAEPGVAVATGASSQPWLWWTAFVVVSVVTGFVWAITLLSYLLPPQRLWGHLLTGDLLRGEALFLSIGTVVFSLEFLLARHLFCRFGCAAGLFQSLVWMANPRGRVVVFAADAGDRPSDCKACDPPMGQACDRACPMGLNPRAEKRRKFSCVQCGLCLSTCDQSQALRERPALLGWAIDAQALRGSLGQRSRRQVLAQPIVPGTQALPPAPSRQAGGH